MNPGTNLSWRITAFTTERVTGNMPVVNWNIRASKFEHLKGIRFLPPANSSCVDIIIGFDYAELHYSLRNIRGKPGEPIARLTPLGWTCTGVTSRPQDGSVSNCIATYFIRDSLVPF
ncbi:hypothetical protein SNE40_018369 [Patella caerulea]|uniref:Uncharacterized protein n=1 Tax=Patella caerulea TaxID=87958 RepID=A0AAN8PL08_PATCE